MKHLPCDKAEIEWIVWKDAVGDSSRTQRDSIAAIALATNINIGWVIREDDELIVLAQGVSTTGEVDHLTIPASCVIERSNPFKARGR